MAEHEGRTVFVPGALPGERVRVRVDRSQKVWRAELLGVLEPSPDRRVPDCPFAEHCGGCNWLHVDDGAQRAAKEEIVLSALEHLGRIPRASVRLVPTLPAPASMAYRRRAVLHPSRGGLGFYGRRTHELVPIEACGALVPALSSLPGRLSPPLASLRGDLAEVHLLAAGAQASIAAMLKGGVKPKAQEAVERAVRELGLAGAVLVPDEGAPTLIGRPTLSAPAPLRPDVTLHLRPDAFTQAHEEGNDALVGAALDALAPSPEDSALELFAGNGNFTFALAGRAREVTAIESGNISVELGRRSTQEARLQNVRWVLGDARRVAAGLAREGRTFDVLLADPPRAGASDLARDARALGVRRVVYVACDPASLARDAALLRDAGFAPSTLQLVDMFPQTHHVEAVMRFDRSD